MDIRDAKELKKRMHNIAKTHGFKRKGSGTRWMKNKGSVTIEFYLRKDLYGPVYYIEMDIDIDASEYLKESPKIVNNGINLEVRHFGKTEDEKFILSSAVHLGLTNEDVWAEFVPLLEARFFDIIDDFFDLEHLKKLYKENFFRFGPCDISTRNLLTGEIYVYIPPPFYKNKRNDIRMAPVDTFSSIQNGSFDDLMYYYKGNINEVNKILDYNLLTVAVISEKDQFQDNIPFEVRLKIIKFLINEGIDINYLSKKGQDKGRNALHSFYSNIWKTDPSYQLEVTKLLVNNGINLNAIDSFGAIPLTYALISNELDTKENAEMYKFLIENGSDYNLKDLSGKSCLDYAKTKEFNREGFLDIVKEYESEKNK